MGGVGVGWREDHRTIVKNNFSLATIDKISKTTARTSRGPVSSDIHSHITGNRLSPLGLGDLSSNVSVVQCFKGPLASFDFVHRDGSHPAPLNFYLVRSQGQRSMLYPLTNTNRQYV